MKKKVAIASILTIALLSIGTIAVLAQKPVTQPQNSPQAQVSIPLNADTIFDLVNQERTKVGLAPLARFEGLQKTSQERADDMIARNYFSHFDPTDSHKMINDQRPGCTGMSENIGMTNGYANDNIEQLDWWMNSKPHHDAILDPRYTLTGVAVSGNKIVQHFCIAK